MSHTLKIAQETEVNFSEYETRLQDYSGFTSLRFVVRDTQLSQRTRVHILIDDNHDDKTVCLSIKITEYALFGDTVKTEIKANYMPISHASEFIYSRVSAHLDTI